LCFAWLQADNERKRVSVSLVWTWKEVDICSVSCQGVAMTFIGEIYKYNFIFNFLYHLVKIIKKIIYEYTFKKQKGKRKGYQTLTFSAFINSFWLTCSRSIYFLFFLQIKQTNMTILQLSILIKIKDAITHPTSQST
jgi:hypothetical protein